MRLHSLVAYDNDGNVTHSLSYLVRYDAEGKPVGLVDFAAHEEAGGAMTDVWTAEGAKGSKVWPEWIGGRIHEFKVELDGPPGRKRLAALVHGKSGHRRVRDDIEGTIQARVDEKVAAAAEAGRQARAMLVKRGMRAVDAIKLANPDPELADISDVIGVPDRPLDLDADGRTVPRPAVPTVDLPILGLSAPAEDVQPGQLPDVQPPSG